MTWLKTAQQHSRTVKPSYSGSHGNRGGRTAKKDRPGNAAGGLNGTKASLVCFNDSGLSTLAINISINHRIPTWAKIVDQFIARTPVIKRNTRRQNHQILVIVLPQPIDDLSHQFQDTTRALKSFYGCPLFIELREYFWMDRITLHHPIIITGFLSFLWYLYPLCNIGISKGTANFITSIEIPNRFKQPPPNNFESLLRRHGLPKSLHPVKNRFQRMQRSDTLRTTSLAVGFR